VRPGDGNLNGIGELATRQQQRRER